MIDIAYPSFIKADENSFSVGPASDKPENGYIWHYWIPVIAVLNPDKFRMRALDEVLTEGGPFLYPMELRWEFLEYISQGYAQPFLTPHIPETVLEAVRQGRAVLMLGYGHEARPFIFRRASDGQPFIIYNVIADFMQRHGLPAGSVWLVNGNLAAQSEFEQWQRLVAAVLPTVPFEMRVAEVFSYIIQSIQRLHMKGKDLGMRWDFEKGSRGDPVHRAMHLELQPLDCAYSDIYATASAAKDVKPSKLFLCMNRITRPHRRVIVCYLELAGLLDRSLVSFRDEAPQNFHFNDPKMEATWQSVQKKQPLTIDRDFPLDFSTVYKEGFSSFKLGEAWPYRETFFNLTNESYYGSDTCFVSEKIWKPIVNGQPFIVTGTPGSLAYLRSLGFKTFAPFIDESYDDIVNDNQRFNRIFSSIQTLGRLSEEQLRDMRRQLQPVVEHNARHMQEITMPMEKVMNEIAFKLEQKNHGSDRKPPQSAAS